MWSSWIQYWIKFNALLEHFHWYSLCCIHLWITVISTRVLCSTDQFSMRNSLGWQNRGRSHPLRIIFQSISAIADIDKSCRINSGSCSREIEWIVNFPANYATSGRSANQMWEHRTSMTFSTITALIGRSRSQRHLGRFRNVAVDSTTVFISKTCFC